MLKFVAIMAIAALVLDDLLTFMDRGDSVIGRFIDSIFGPGSASAAVDNLWEAWDRLTFFWTDTVEPTMMAVGAAAAEMAVVIGDELGAVVDGQIEAWGEFFAIWRAGFEDVQKAFGLLERFGFDLGSAVAGGDSVGEFRGQRRRTEAQQGRIPAPAAAVLQSLPGQNMSIDASTHVTVEGNASAADAGRIADASSEGRNRAARRTQAALTQEAE
jgi:hypothetical protein